MNERVERLLQELDELVDQIRYERIARHHTKDEALETAREEAGEPEQKRAPHFIPTHRAHDHVKTVG